MVEISAWTDAYCVVVRHIYVLIYSFSQCKTIVYLLLSDNGNTIWRWNVTIPGTLVQSHLPRNGVSPSLRVYSNCQRHIVSVAFCGRCATPKNCRVHRSEVEIGFHSHRCRDPGLRKRRCMGLISLKFRRRLSSSTGEPRETSFNGFWLSVTLQRYNAIAFRGKYPGIEGCRITGWGLREWVVYWTGGYTENNYNWSNQIRTMKIW